MRSCIISTNIKRVSSCYLLLNKGLLGSSHTHTNRKRQDVAIKIAFIDIIVCQRHHVSKMFTNNFLEKQTNKFDPIFKDILALWTKKQSIWILVMKHSQQLGMCSLEGERHGFKFQVYLLQLLLGNIGKIALYICFLSIQ